MGGEKLFPTFFKKRGCPFSFLFVFFGSLVKIVDGMCLGLSCGLFHWANVSVFMIVP